MPGLSVKTRPLVSKAKPFPADVGTAVTQLENTGGPVAQATSNALRYVQTSLNDLHSALRNTSPDVQEIKVTDHTGKVVAFLGDFEFKGVVTRNYFSELHIGDPLGTGDPTQAVINVDADGRITIGSTGWVDVLDPFGADAAWIGTQYDTLAITGAAASSTTPLIRLTVPGHAFVTGDAAIVLNVGGVPNATGAYVLTVIDATHVDLQASVFDGAYTSGGTINRLLHITGSVNNGAGLIRLTVTAHGYESGDRVNVDGIPGAGQWTIKVITANTFDLVGSTFASYSGGGTCQRYFAGGLFQTIAVGPSFSDYRLRAFADGSLRIKDAEIELVGANGTILLDPDVPAITVSDNGGNQWAALEIVEDAPKSISAATNASPVVVTINAHGYVNGDTILVAGATGNTAINGYRIVKSATANTFTMTTVAGSAVNGNGAYAGTGTATRYYAGGLFESIAIGPSWGGAKLRGYADGSLAITDAAITLNGTDAKITLDPTIGSMTIDGSATPAGIKMVVEVAGIFANTTSGPSLIAQFDVTDIKCGSPFPYSQGYFEFRSVGPTYLSIFDTTQFLIFESTGKLSVSGDVNAVGVFRKNGVAGIGASRPFGTSLTVNSAGNGVFGTPAVGQFNSTVVTGVTLNLTTNTWSGGILTA